MGDPLDNQLGQGWTRNASDIALPVGMNTSELSDDASIDKSATALLGGLNTSPANINFKMSHNVEVNPRYYILSDSLRSFLITLLNAVYNGFVFARDPYADITSGHHTNGDLPNKSLSMPAENFYINFVINLGCS